MPKTKSLTIRQEKFINGVIEGKSYRQAALEAGYTPATAKNADKNIVAKRGVQEELAERIEAQGISADWVLSNLKQDVERMANDPNPVRTRSLELLGKAAGIFSEKVGEGKIYSGLNREHRESVYRDVLEITRSGKEAWEIWGQRVFGLLEKYVPEEELRVLEFTGNFIQDWKRHFKRPCSPQDTAKTSKE